MHYIVWRVGPNYALAPLWDLSVGTSTVAVNARSPLGFGIFITEMITLTRPEVEMPIKPWLMNAHRSNQTSRVETCSSSFILVLADCVRNHAANLAYLKPWGSHLWVEGVLLCIVGDFLIFHERRLKYSIIWFIWLRKHFLCLVMVGASGAHLPQTSAVICPQV